MRTAAALLSVWILGACGGAAPQGRTPRATGRLTVRTQRDLQMHNARRVELFGTYRAIVMPSKRPSRAANLPREYALIELGDTTIVYLEKYNTPLARRSLAERRFYDGHQVRVWGVVQKICPSAGQAPSAACLTGIRRISIVSRPRRPATRRLRPQAHPRLSATAQLRRHLLRERRLILLSDDKKVGSKIKGLACAHWGVKPPRTPGGRGRLLKHSYRYGVRMKIHLSYTLRAGVLELFYEGYSGTYWAPKLRKPPTTVAGVCGPGARDKKRCAALGIERYRVRKVSKTRVTLDRGTLFTDHAACRRGATHKGARPFDFGRMKLQRLEAAVWIRDPTQDHLGAVLKRRGFIYWVVGKGRYRYCQRWKVHLATYTKTRRRRKVKLSSLVLQRKVINRQKRLLTTHRWGIEYKGLIVNLTGPSSSTQNFRTGVSDVGGALCGYGYQVKSMSRHSAVVGTTEWFFSRRSCLAKLRRTRAFRPGCHFPRRRPRATE